MTDPDGTARNDDPAITGGNTGDDNDGGLPDLVATMNQMQSSGRIDTSAFRGERNDDDVAMLGEQGTEDGDIVDE